MRFQVEGPFELYRTAQGLIDAGAEARRYYWEWVEDNSAGLSQACGCYVFAVQASRGTLPWYIGKAERQSFRNECLSPHKLNHFNTVIAGRKGKPVLFFLPQLTATGNYRSPTSTKRPAIRELEALLIGMGISRNSDLVNKNGTRWLQQITVEGFLNRPKDGRGASKALRALFGR